jgi:CarD family transcriptional regulator
MIESNFQVGDKAVHPAHGVGEVTAIERREIGGSAGSFYVLRIIDSGMKVMIPLGGADTVGLRGVMSPEDADLVLEVFSSSEKTSNTGPWNRRQRVYNDMLKTGLPTEVAKVLRDLYRVKFGNAKELSYGERRLIDHAKGLILKELSLAKRTTEIEMERQIESLCSKTVLS